MDPKKQAQLDALTRLEHSPDESEAEFSDSDMDSMTSELAKMNLKNIAPGTDPVPSMFDNELKGQYEEVVQGPEHQKLPVDDSDITPRISHLMHKDPLTRAQTIAAEHLSGPEGEGFTPVAEFDTNKPRIGHGSEDYEDGSLVDYGDTVDRDRAYDMVINRLVRDTKSIDKVRDKLPLLEDPSVEAMTLSRMYQQGPGNVLKPGKQSGLYEALQSGRKKKFAEAIKGATPSPEKYSTRLNREAQIVLDSQIRDLAGKRKK